MVWGMGRFCCHSVLLIPVILILIGCDRRARPDSPAGRVDGLILEQAWPIEGDRPLEPSGLFFDGETFFTVSDDTDNTIFQLEFDDAAARAQPYLTFESPAAGMDFEGIVRDAQGAFYLVSERYSGILRVSPDSEASWLGGRLDEGLSSTAILDKRNAGLEAITGQKAGGFLLLAERDERGWIEVDREGDATASGALPDTLFWDNLPAWRSPDFSGLDQREGRTYGLFRNAYLVVELVKVDGRYLEAPDAWSYAEVETSSSLGYEDATFGQAEGLVVSNGYLWIIVDNNFKPRKANPRDRRPQLWKFRLPED